MPAFEVWFRHRSSVLILLTWPIVVWTLGPRSPTAAQLGLGTGLVCAGGALRLTAARCLGRGARVQRAAMRGALLTTGPYAATRNPLYVAAAMVLAGLALDAGAGWQASLLFAATLFVYTPVVIHEEGVLRRAAGEEFAAYARAVPRWIGAPAALPSRSTERASWRAVLRREARLVPGLAVAVGAIALTRAGVLPLRMIFEAFESKLRVSRAGLCAAGLLLGAACNSIAIERKRTRQALRRARRAREPLESSSLRT